MVVYVKNRNELLEKLFNANRQACIEQGLFGVVAIRMRKPMFSLSLQVARQVGIEGGKACSTNDKLLDTDKSSCSRKYGYLRVNAADVCCSKDDALCSYPYDRMEDEMIQLHIVTMVFGLKITHK